MRTSLNRIVMFSTTPAFKASAESSVREISTAYSSVSAEFQRCAAQIRPLLAVEPTNEREERARFDPWGTREPEFSYRPVQPNLPQVRESLRRIQIPDAYPPLSNLLETKRQGLLLSSEICEAVGNAGWIRALTMQMHGTPSAELVARARAIVREDPPPAIEKPLPATHLQTVFREALTARGMVDWTVELSEKKLIAVRAAERLITIGSSRTFSPGDCERLVAHEIDVHALRAHNGFLQPIPLLGTGLPGSLETEEGLALYAEGLSGHLDLQMLRSYAGRVLAVDAACKGASFRDAFDQLRTSGFDTDDAWTLAVRAYRGGGYLKDHVYLSGYAQVMETAKTGADLRWLYCGKVALEHHGLVQQMLADGLLNPPARLPAFLGNHREDAAVPLPNLDTISAS